MRRLIKLLSPLILTMLFLSCVQSVEQDATITFNANDAVSRAVQYSNNTVTEETVTLDASQFNWYTSTLLAIPNGDNE